MSGFVDRSNASRPGDDSYGQLISRIAEQGVCPFCPEHIHEIHTKPFFEETDYWLATENIKPYNNTTQHLLFVHREHIETIGEMSTEAWVDLLDLIKGSVKNRQIAGSTILMRNGDTRYTGASVSHLHAQLISGTGDPENPVLVKAG